MSEAEFILINDPFKRSKFNLPLNMFRTSREDRMLRLQPSANLIPSVTLIPLPHVGSVVTGPRGWDSDKFEDLRFCLTCLILKCFHHVTDFTEALVLRELIQ